MKSPATRSPVITLPSEARAIRAFGDEATFFLEGKLTGSKLALWTNITPPGGGPPPHYHDREDEWFVVQEGLVQFLANGTWQEVPPGGVVFALRGSVHTFKKVGDKPSRLLISTSPSGFETFFARCAEEFQKPAGPDMKRIMEISAEHGIHFVT